MLEHQTFDEHLNESKRKKLLVPRRSREERSRNHMIATQQQIQKYIKDGSKGDLDFTGTPVTSLPDILKKVGGNLIMDHMTLQNAEPHIYLSLPKNLKVEGNLDLSVSKIKSLPVGLKVGGDLILTYTKIKSLPKGLEVKGNLILSFTDITSIPRNVKVGGDLILTHRIESIASDLKVDGTLEMPWFGGAYKPLLKKYTKDELVDLLPNVKNINLVT